MKSFRNFVSYAMGIMTVALMVTSCTEQEDLENKKVQSEGLNTCTMVLKGGLVAYDQTTRSADSTTVWADGSIVYLQFLNGENRIPGDAVYSAETDQWTVSYYGALPESTSLTCEARFFENIDSTTTAGLVVTNEHTAIYEDLQGTYLYENEELTVVANLTPKTGRIRFVGDKGTKVILTGITSYTTYEPRSNHYMTTNKLIELTTDENESTPYIYGYFTNDTVKYLGLMANDYAFTKACKETVLEKGKSGYMSIPTINSCNGWEKGLRVRVKGVEFLMIPCPKFDEKSSFAIGEIEVTQELYQVVINASSTKNKNYPQGMSYSAGMSFINSLNKLTSLNFTLPTAAQWKYAAKGGSSSQGYTYSGSNDADLVAWYAGNATGTHKVKTKQANELGIYDMSGNVAEWITNSNSSYWFCFGGSYLQNKNDIKITSQTSTSSIGSSPSNYAVGVRLAINY